MVQFLTTSYELEEQEEEEDQQDRQELLDTSTGIAQIVLLNSLDKESSNQAMEVLANLAEKEIDLIPKMASVDIIRRLFLKLETRDSEESSNAIKCLSAFSVSSDD